MSYPILLCRASFSAGLAMLFAALPLATPARAVEPTAQDLLRRAHEGRALWHQWPGFSAEIVVSTNGEVADGQLSVTSDGQISLGSLGAPHREWAARRIQSLVDHRLSQNQTSYDVSFIDEQHTHPLGRLIRFDRDRLHSMYRIADDVITEVHRTTETTRFTITVTEVQRNAEGEHLPRAYSVSWWNVATGELTASDVIHNEWVRVGNFDLPSRLLSVRTEGDGRREVGEIRFRHHRLFEAAAGQ